MTRTTHHGPQQTVRLAFVAVLMLGLTGCAVAGTSGAKGSGASPSSSSDEGTGSIGEIPEEAGGDEGAGVAVARTAARGGRAHARGLRLVQPSQPDGGRARRRVDPQGGGHSLELFDTKSDADNALKVARNWKRELLHRAR